MKKLLLIALFAIPSLLSAQTEPTAPSAQPVQAASTLRFGVVYYDSLLCSLPDYAMAQRQLDMLSEKYEAEGKRAEEEFNAKYEEFLEGQADFPPTILKKRQTELQEHLDRNIAFKEESRRLLAQAAEEIFQPLHDKIADILARIGAANNLSFILNRDSHSCPYVNPSQGVDVTKAAIELGMKN